MTYAIQQRSRCRVCSAPHPELYLELPPLPLTDDFVSGARPGGEFLHPIRIYRCAACGVSQTQHDVDTRDYYREYRYTTSASHFTREFMAAFARQSWSRFNLRPGDTVVEIGSGDGQQLEYYRRLGARVFGFEPSDPLVAGSRRRGVPVAARLFDSGAEQEIPPELRPVQLIVLCYTFDHLPYPMEFLAAARRVLDPQRGVLLIEVHDLDQIAARREFCLFAHEHATYCSAATMQNLMRQAGLEVIEVGLLPEKQRRGNSLVIGAAPLGSAAAPRPMPQFPAGVLADAAAHVALGRAVMTSIERLRAWVRERRAAGCKLAGYGAGGRGVMTLAACARPGDFAYVCDKNTSFHGLYTPGARVPVVAPAHALTEPVDEMLVFSFGYFDEIRRDLAEFERRGGRLVSLLDRL